MAKRLIQILLVAALALFPAAAEDTAGAIPAAGEAVADAATTPEETAVAVTDEAAADTGATAEGATGDASASTEEASAEAFCAELPALPSDAPAGLITLDIDDIELADMPIRYGEISFRARILERTKGERDPIGLVLTGGSARAFAHLGVLEYLEEVGIEPDFIISNSMGSIIALLYAAGLSPDQIMRVVTSGDLSTFFKLTLPIEGGLLEGSGFEGLVDSVVGADTRIEDLPIPVMVICQDLVTKREVRMMEGDFTDVLMASFALPAYFPPVEYKGHLLIDGGVVNLAPIDVAYEYTDTVIVSTTFYDNDSLNLKNVLNVINTSFEIVKRSAAAADIRAHKVDMIWIRCAVEDFSFMAFGEAEAMSKIGYESALAEAGALSSLYRGGISGEVLELRAAADERIDRVSRNQFYFERVEHPDHSHTISLGMHSYQDDDYPRYLRSTFDLGLEYKWAYRTVEFTALAGGAFDNTRNNDVTHDFLVSAGFGWYPLSSLRFTLDAAATWEGAPKWIPSLYFRQGFDWKFWSNGSSDIGFHEAAEVYHDFREGEESRDQYMVTAILKGSFDIAGKFRLDADFGYMLHMDRLLGRPRHYLQGGASTRLYFIPGTNFYLDLGARTRFSVDGKGGVPIYTHDGFVTNSPEVNDSSKFTDGVNGSRQNYFVTVPLSFGWDFSSTPSFGEILIADDLELSAYCDLLFYDGPVPEFTTGVELQFSLSLIGLQSIPMTFRFGWDNPSQDVIFSLRFTVSD